MKIRIEPLDKHHDRAGFSYGQDEMLQKSPEMLPKRGDRLPISPDMLLIQSEKLPTFLDMLRKRSAE